MSHFLSLSVSRSSFISLFISHFLLRFITLTDCIPSPQLLPWILTPATALAVHKAADALDTLVSDTEFRAFHFTAFGKDHIKRFNLSPDAFFQVALQLAYYRLHNRTCATYETAHTRLFALGRTETIRSATSASAAFTRAMGDPAISISERARLFRTAVATHSAYTKDAMEGNGVDRHMLGLRLICKEVYKQVNKKMKKDDDDDDDERVSKKKWGPGIERY